MLSLDCPLLVASSCVFSDLYYRMVETCVTLRDECVNLISSKHIFFNKVQRCMCFRQHGPSLKKEDGVRGRGRIGSSRF
jgi:hypothetical protein